MNKLQLERRLRRLEEKVGVKDNLSESEETDPVLLKKLKSAHFYEIENNEYLAPKGLFDYKTLIAKTKSQYKSEGLDESFFDKYFRSFNVSLVSKEGKLIVFGYARSFPNGYFKGNFQWGQMILGISNFSDKRTFLKWKNSLFLELEEYVRINKIPYSGIQAKTYLRKIATDRYEELVTSNYLNNIEINEKLAGIVEEYFPDL